MQESLNRMLTSALNYARLRFIAMYCSFPTFMLSDWNIEDRSCRPICPRARHPQLSVGRTTLAEIPDMYGTESRVSGTSAFVCVFFFRCSEFARHTRFHCVFSNSE